MDILPNTQNKEPMDKAWGAFDEFKIVICMSAVSEGIVYNGFNNWYTNTNLGL